VTAIACFSDFFVACHMDGTVCHHQLPSGNNLKNSNDQLHVHTNAVPLGEKEVICGGYYPDIVILDGYTLEITLRLQSREQADWLACFRYFPKESGTQVQGITTNGFLKTWAIGDAEEGVCLENSLGPMNVRHSKAISFHMSRKWLLLVTTSQVLVFDVAIHLLFKHTSNDALEGGDFYMDKILFWTKRGHLYESDLKTKIIKRILTANGMELHVPGNRLIVIRDHVYFGAADITGSVWIWKLQIENDTVVPVLVTTGDANQRSNDTVGLVDGFGVTVLCSVHISHLNKFIAGCQDGKLMIFPATDLILNHFLDKSNCNPDILSGHQAPVRCLLYPHLEDSNFEENILVSGGDDFCVCLWDILKKTLLHKFCVHSGPVVRLLLPPGECNIRMGGSVCSVSVDHSVAILSIRDRRCTFLASQHPFPIVAVRWKPCHDFLVVKCFDGSVFVWELRTGVLDRVVCGVAAEEVVYGCDVLHEDVLWDFYTAGPTADELPRQPLHLSLPHRTKPVDILGFLTSSHIESFLFILNVNKLCSHLQTILPHSSEVDDSFCKIHALAKPPAPVGVQKALNSVLDAIKNEAEHLQDKFHLSIMSKTQPKNQVNRKVSSVSGTQLIPYAQLALSLLHVWKKDIIIDETCIQELGLKLPKMTVSFDICSETGYLSLRHPCNGDLERTRRDIVTQKALAHVFSNFSFSETSSQSNPATWKQVLDHAETNIVLNDILSCEKLSSQWQTKSVSVRNVIKTVLSDHLTTLDAETRDSLYEKWRRFLPSARTKDNEHLCTISLVLCSILTIENKLKGDDSEHVNEICQSLRYVLTRCCGNSVLLATAIDLVGIGYRRVWGDLLPVDEIILLCFKNLKEKYKNHDARVTLAVRKTLAELSSQRMSQLVAFLKYMCKTGHPDLEESKSEILTLVQDLLSQVPDGILPLLSDVVEVLLACIDPAHLREAELEALLGVWVPQLHHNLSGNRVAVGMPDGKVVVHDLRARKINVFPAHKESISALQFSPDGKLLFVLSSSGVASLWQLSHGIFDIGVGQFRFKNVKEYPTTLPMNNVIKNISVLWSDSKTVTIETMQDSSTPPSVVTLSI